MRCGFAVDVGTTNIEISLWNLDSGMILGKKISRNCLYLYGADVVSRILYAHYNGVEVLQRKLIAQLKTEFSQMVREFCGEFAPKSGGFVTGCGDSSFVADCAVFTGNTVMLHFLSGLSVAGFEKAPFTPVSLFGEVEPGDSALASLAKEVILPPCIGAFLGADIVCASLAISELDGGTAADTAQEVHAEPYIVIDIGTNTEIMLVDANGKRTACSAAAGPAFEGGGLSVDMKGSALVSELARMLDEGIMDETGYIGADDIPGTSDGSEDVEVSCSGRDGVSGNQCAPVEQNFDESGGGDTSDSGGRSISSGNKRRTILSQQDVRQIQLAKGATAAAVETLLLSVGKGSGAGGSVERDEREKTNAEKCVCEPKNSLENLQENSAEILQENSPKSQLLNIKKCFICGNFGNALDISAVKKTGLLPAKLADCAVYAGNAALRGAEAILLSKTAALSHAREIAQKTTVLQLADSAVFAEKYIKRMNFTAF